MSKKLTLEDFNKMNRREKLENYAEFCKLRKEFQKQQIKQEADLELYILLKKINEN